MVQVRLLNLVPSRFGCDCISLCPLYRSVWGVGERGMLLCGRGSCSVQWSTSIQLWSSEAPKTEMSSCMHALMLLMSDRPHICPFSRISSALDKVWLCNSYPPHTHTHSLPQTSNTATFLLFELAKQPSLQDKLHKEIQDTLRERSRLTSEDLQRTSLLRGCVKETLRLYPPMAVGKREAGGEMVVDGYRVPAGVSYINE